MEYEVAIFPGQWLFITGGQVKNAGSAVILRSKNDGLPASNMFATAASGFVTSHDWKVMPFKCLEGHSMGNLTSPRFFNGSPGHVA